MQLEGSWRELEGSRGTKCKDHIVEITTIYLKQKWGKNKGWPNSQPVAHHSNHHSFSTAINTGKRKLKIYRLSPHTNQFLMAKVARVAFSWTPPTEWKRLHSHNSVKPWLFENRPNKSSLSSNLGMTTCSGGRDWLLSSGEGNLHSSHSVWMRGPGGKSCLMLLTPDFMAQRMVVCCSGWG